MTKDVDVQGLQSKAEARLASLKEEKLVTRIAVLSTLHGQDRKTERLMIRMSIETHKTSRTDQRGDRAKDRISRRWLILIATCLSRWIVKTTLGSAAVGCFPCKTDRRLLS
jgi:hypothetical protein